MSKIIDMSAYWIGFRHGRGALEFNPPLDVWTWAKYEEGYFKGYQEAVRMFQKNAEEKGEL